MASQLSVCMVPGYRVHECRGELAHGRAGPVNEQFLCAFCAYLYSKREISAKTFQLHEAHCSHNITLCELCQEPVLLRQREEHYQRFHQPATFQASVRKDAMDQPEA